MLQAPDNQKTQFSTPNFTPPKTVNVPVEQATIGRSVVIKGEVSGSESLHVDGRIEGIGTEAVNRFRRKGDQPAAAQRFRRATNRGDGGLQRMDLINFRHRS